MSPVDELIRVDKAVDEALKYIDGRRQGLIKSIKTPWKKFNDAHLDGIEWQKIIALGGMSSSGKTLIASQLERELFDLNPDQNFMVLSFNMEMPSRQIVIRNIIGRHNIKNDELLSAKGLTLSDEKFEMIKVDLKNELGRYPIYYVEHPKTVRQYKFLVRAFYEKMRVPFFVISDHTILFKKEENELSHLPMLYNLADAMIELKKELPVTQIPLTQLNRVIEDKDRRIPKSILNYPDKSCVFGSDAVYQCSDTLMVNHRPALLNFAPNTYGPNKLACEENDLYWHFIKARDGAPNLIAAMTADFSNMKILDR
ncbi:MAG TPA: DnaB-like helicase C-terminal domain-containing protein [Puia sp.]|jgi:replicative DNA helicase